MASDFIYKILLFLFIPNSNKDIPTTLRNYVRALVFFTMGSKVRALSVLIVFLASISCFPAINACGDCGPPPSYRQPPYSRPTSPIPTHPPYGKRPPRRNPPQTSPPVIAPPVLPPPIVKPPPAYTHPPDTGGTKPYVCPPPPTPGKCPIDALKLGLCVDLLGGLVHIGLGDPVENVCCPVLHGLVELEAALCLCTAIRIKVLSLNIFVPLALNVLITCGMEPPPGFFCPAL